MKMQNSNMINVCVLFAVLLIQISVQAQMPPDPIGRKLPDFGPDRIEVRFAYNKKTINCEVFHLIAKAEGKTIIDSDFNCGFNIPPEAKALTRDDDLDLDFQCGTYHWYFTKVGKRAFLPGYWWVGTDYPPFYDRQFQTRQYRDALWVKYLLIDPSIESGYTVWKKCSKKFKNKKPGPCYE
jgi:hypothetical protein